MNLTTTTNRNTNERSVNDPRYCTKNQEDKDIKLNLVSLSKTYDKKTVVDNVSLAVPDNELVTLLGPSGSGKTTTMMMIAGFVTPDLGDVELDGESIMGVPPYRRNIGVVFQNYALFPHMTVLANVEFPLRQRGIRGIKARNKAREALALVGLEGFESRRVPNLSGGQQQRVSLARALVFDPPLLIMDEPLSALDKRLREQMQEEIKRIQKAVNATILCVTHDQTEAFVLSDRIAVMNNGKILQVGSPRDVYDHPKDDFVAEFLGESNLLNGYVEVDRHGEKVFHTERGMSLVIGRSAPEDGRSLLVRPEQIILSRHTENNNQEYEMQDVNTLLGTVVSVSFVGSSTMYRVDCGGEIFTIRQASDNSEPFVDGEFVKMMMSSQHCAVMNGDS